MHYLKLMFLILFLVVGLGFVSSGLEKANASTVTDYSGAWIPKDTDIKFVKLGSGEVDFFLTNKDKDDHLNLTLGKPKTVNFDFGSHQFSFDDQTLQVGENNYFWLGYDNGDEMVYDYDYTVKGKNYNLTFGDTNVKQFRAAPIPLPAAAWFLGAGLVVMIGFRRFYKS